MVKINDQVLAQAGIELKNEKLLPVANLADEVVLTLSGEPFRRRLKLVFDSATPSDGSSAAIIATYRSPKDVGVRWFAGSLSNANVDLQVKVTGKYASPKGDKFVTYTDRTVETNDETSIIGDQAIGMAASTEFVAASVWIPPDGLLTVQIAGLNGGQYTNTQFNWTLLGWTESAPRTEDTSEVVKPDKAIVVP